MDELEPARLKQAVGDPHPKPEFFDDRYVLPVHGNNLLLQVTNKHERDDFIVFHEEPHIYAVHGIPAGTSVSSLAHEFEEPFEPMLGIRAMQRSKSEAWPRLTYVVNAKEVTIETMNVQMGCLLHDTKTNKTMSSLHPDISRNSTSVHIFNILKSAMCKQISEAHCKLYNFERCMTDDDIKAKWEANGMDARNRGTEAHLQMELWFNSLPCRVDDPEVVVGLKFVKDCLIPIGAKGYRTEWEIFAEEEDVAGCIDLAVQLPDGSVYLIDWKRSEKLPSKMKGYKKMKAPLNNLEDCSGCSYSLQLSAYQYIIEKYYGLKIVGRALVSLHPDAPFITKVPYLKEEIEYIMKKRMLLTSTRKRLEREPDYDHLKCCKTGRIADDAVKDEHGNVYWIKGALLHDVKNTTKCEKISAEASELLKKETPETPLPTEKIPWKTHFPKPSSDLLCDFI